MVGPLWRARAADAPRGPWHWQPRLPRDVEPRRVGIHARTPPIVLYLATREHRTHKTTRAKSAFHKSNKTPENRIGRRDATTVASTRARARAHALTSQATSTSGGGGDGVEEERDAGRGDWGFGASRRVREKEGGANGARVGSCSEDKQGMLVPVTCEDSCNRERDDWTRGAGKFCCPFDRLLFTVRRDVRLKGCLHHF